MPTKKAKPVANKNCCKSSFEKGLQIGFDMGRCKGRIEMLLEEIDKDDARIAVILQSDDRKAAIEAKYEDLEEIFERIDQSKRKYALADYVRRKKRALE